MIPRYTRPEMAAIWSDQNKYKIWYLIEAHATEKLAELGVVPQSAVEAVWKAKDVEFDVDRINEIEAEVKHDVIAFLTHLAEHVGEVDSPMLLLTSVALIGAPSPASVAPATLRTFASAPNLRSK